MKSNENVWKMRNCLTQKALSSSGLFTSKQVVGSRTHVQGCGVRSGRILTFSGYNAIVRIDGSSTTGVLCPVMVTTSLNGHGANGKGAEERNQNYFWAWDTGHYHLSGKATAFKALQTRKAIPEDWAEDWDQLGRNVKGVLG